MRKKPVANPGRFAAHELDPELRDRLLSLEEPVSRADWNDVLARPVDARSASAAAAAALPHDGLPQPCAPHPRCAARQPDRFLGRSSAPRSAESTFSKELVVTLGVPPGRSWWRHVMIRSPISRLDERPSPRRSRAADFVTMALQPGTATSGSTSKAAARIPSGALTLSYDDLASQHRRIRPLPMASQ